DPAEWISGRPGGTTADPADRVTLDESVSMAFLVVLESMTPAGRVAFILHDVFGYPFAQVAEVTGRTPAACPQLAPSAPPAARAPGNGRILARRVTGQPGRGAQQAGVTVTVFAFDVAGDRIKRIWAVRTPDKLQPWTARAGDPPRR